jgi:hypothetical protein
LKIIYLTPTIGTYNVNQAFDEIASLKKWNFEEQIAILNKNNDIIAKELDELKIKLASLIQQMNKI